MIDINLLPPEYGPKKLINLSSLVIIGAFLLISVSLLGSSWRLMAAIEDYSERVNDYNQQISENKQQAETVREQREKMKERKPRLSLAKELLQGRITWSGKFVELNRHLPRGGIWLNGLTIKRQKVAQRSPKVKPKDAEAEPIIVSISGNVVSVDKVSQFVANLEDSEIFANVVFDSATSGSMKPGSDSLISFRLTVQIKEGL